MGLDTKVYPLEVTIKAAYLFLDRCYVFMFHDEAGTLRVHLKPKPDWSGNLSDIVGEFLNELLNQSVRRQIASESQNLRELIMARALYEEVLETTPIEAPAGGDGEAAREDVLGIGRDWFEAHGTAA